MDTDPSSPAAPSGRGTLPCAELRCTWGELYLCFREPLLRLSLVEQCRRLVRGRALSELPPDELAACGLDGITVEGSPSPVLCWADQDRLHIRPRAGVVPKGEYWLRFRPGTRYLSGEALEGTAFRFRFPARPVQLESEWLHGHAGGAALIVAGRSEEPVARRLPQNMAEIQVCFEPMEQGEKGTWHRTGRAVPARLRPATLADGLGRGSAALEELLMGTRAQELTPDTLLPHALLALPECPLQAGACYAVRIDTSPQSGLLGGTGRPECFEGQLKASVCTELVQQGRGAGAPWATQLELRFSHPVPEGQLQALWAALGIRTLGGAESVQASWQAGGYYAFPKDSPFAPLELHLQELLPCEPGNRCWCRGGEYRYSPPGCAMGLRLLARGDVPAELEFALPPLVATSHGLGWGDNSLRLRAALMPALPLLVGDGCNIVPLHGGHCLRLPCTNLGRVEARAYRWEAEDAARLLPDILASLRDDTPAREFGMFREWLLGREAAGIRTPGSYRRKALAELSPAAEKLEWEQRLRAVQRQRVLAAARAYPVQELRAGAGSSPLVEQGELLLDLDRLSGGDLQAGLHLISVSYAPSHAVLAACGQYQGRPGIAPPPCTVDYLVQVTDMSPCRVEERLLLNSLHTGEPLEGVTALLAGDATAPPTALRDGEMELPPARDGGLLLLRREGDYSLFSLEAGLSCRDEGDDDSPGQRPRPRAVMFCDRPLYRPGDTIYLRGLLRCPRKGGLALPRAREGTLRFCKGNGQEIATQQVQIDAFGSFACEFRMPGGEEEVAGFYRCEFCTMEGRSRVEAELCLSCQHFRRDAFEASLSLELEPVAPRGFRVQVEARDYDGTPVAGGKATVRLRSPAAFSVEADGASGTRSHERSCTLELDAEGRAELRGSFASCPDAGYLRVSADVANTREEYVRPGEVEKPFYACDFRIGVDSFNRLRLIDSRTQEALTASQKLWLTVTREEESWDLLPSGIRMRRSRMRTLLRRRLTVPAGCRQGLPLEDVLHGLDGARRDWSLSLSATDSCGRKVREQCGLAESYYDDGGEPGRMRAEGRQLTYSPAEPFPATQRLHAFISSQGRLRHVLVPVAAGAESAVIPLEAHEYGEIILSLISCGRDATGQFCLWSLATAACEAARPDRELRISLELPEGAAPGSKVTLRGQVGDATGQPVRAALTLWAVDAGMLSVAPYGLPGLTSLFYRGHARRLWLHAGCDGVRRLPKPLPMPGLGAPIPQLDWDSLSYDARWRRPLPRGIVGKGLPCHQRLGYIVAKALKQKEPRFGWRLGIHSDGAWDERLVLLDACCCKSLADEDVPFMADPPRLRRDFAPVALWQASLETAADGSFLCTAQLPDTLTTYRVFAVALSADGESFGKAEGDFRISQPLMLTAGTPFFMSTGDRLRLPLSISNNSDAAGSWRVTLTGADNAPAAQQVGLAAGSSTTLYFEVQAGEEGEALLRWTASSAGSGDAVEARFPLRYPAPLLKESHRLVLDAAGGTQELDPGGLLATELAESTRGSLELQYSTSPLLHAAGNIDFLLDYPYGCTEQRASALLPWLLHSQLAPFCPRLAATPAAEARAIADKAIGDILKRQQKDGGLSYWGGPHAESCAWASAYAALVLSLAAELGEAVPDEAAMAQLRAYLRQVEPERGDWPTRYAIARACGQEGQPGDILAQALAGEGTAHSCCGRQLPSLLAFLAELHHRPAARHEALLRWMRSRGAGFFSSWSSGWSLIALAEYLRLEGGAAPPAELLIDGESRIVMPAAGTLCLKATGGSPLRALAPRLAVGRGRVYLLVKAKAQPQQADYPGLTEKGLQLTRTYETRDAAGRWQENRSFKVGDVVRITLSCAKIEPELGYLVLEDYLPACMEAINPHVPGQAAGLEDGGWGCWSRFFDNREYLPDRVRGFCTRWCGRSIANMSYYARVKRAGECMAPPAEAQLMYEPQCYGLSRNTLVRSEM